MGGSKFGFGRKAEAWEGLKKQALQEMAIDAKGTFDKAFDMERLPGNKRWKEVQRRIPGTQAYNRANGDERTANILTGETGTLSSGNEIESVSSSKMVIVNDTSYAGYHNEGTDRLAARPFMVQTDRLTKNQLRILKQVTGKVWNVK